MDIEQERQARRMIAEGCGCNEIEIACGINTHDMKAIREHPVPFTTAELDELERVNTKDKTTLNQIAERGYYIEEERFARRQRKPKSNYETVAKRLAKCFKVSDKLPNLTEKEEGEEKATDAH